MVEIAVGGCIEFECTEADVVERFIVDTEGLIRVLNELVNGEGGVIWLHNGVGHLRHQQGSRIAAYFWRRNNGESAHHPVWVFFPDLRDEESTHARAGTSSERVGDLEPLEAIGRLGLAADHIEYGVNELRTCASAGDPPGQLTFSVVTLSPIIPRTALAKDTANQQGPTVYDSQVVRAEQAAEGTTTNRVHGPRLEVDEDRSWHILARSRLVVVDIDPLELDIRRALVRPVCLDTVLL